MVSVGITGGIGSGKTTVCNIWESLGAFVLNADDLAKKIMTEDEEVIAEIKDTFGEASYQADGSLNRNHLSDQAFQKGRVDELNAIVHPRIPEKSEQIKETARKQGCKLFVYEAALLLENIRPGFLDYIVMVLAEQENRVERVQKRDKVPEENVLQRIEKQQNFEEQTHLADFVIYNNGTLKELEEKSKKIFHELVAST